jgi:hypothetical protein
MRILNPEMARIPKVDENPRRPESLSTPKSPKVDENAG